MSGSQRDATEQRSIADIAKALAHLATEHPDLYDSERFWLQEAVAVLQGLQSKPSETATSETDEAWYERETAAFKAWWESEGEKKFSASPTMAAGAGWLARAEAARSSPSATAMSASEKALRELLLVHADYDDGEGNKCAAVLRGRLACIRDILRGT